MSLNLYKQAKKTYSLADLHSFCLPYTGGYFGSSYCRTSHFVATLYRLKIQFNCRTSHLFVGLGNDSALVKRIVRPLQSGRSQRPTGNGWTVPLPSRRTASDVSLFPVARTTTVRPVPSIPRPLPDWAPGSEPKIPIPVTGSVPRRRGLPLPHNDFVLSRQVSCDYIYTYYYITAAGPVTWQWRTAQLLS